LIDWWKNREWVTSNVEMGKECQKMRVNAALYTQILGAMFHPEFKSYLWKLRLYTWTFFVISEKKFILSSFLLGMWAIKYYCYRCVQIEKLFEKDHYKC